MKISRFFHEGRPIRSFEVFPPKRDGDVESLYRAFEELKPLGPDYISVTYGAGGSNVGLHYEINTRLVQMGLTPLAHFTCVGQDREAIAAQLDRLWSAGVRNILALRGDPPKGRDRFEPHPNGFAHASDLIAFIKGRWDFCVGAAAYPEGHPEALSLAEDLANTKRKAEAGAEFFVTQMFFDNQAYFDFVKLCRTVGIAAPIVPGVMPVLNSKFFVRDWGIRIPADFKAAIEQAEAPGEAEAVGLDFAVRQCRGLTEGGAPGLHLYIMNKVKPARVILDALKA